VRETLRNEQQQISDSGRSRNGYRSYTDYGSGSQHASILSAANGDAESSPFKRQMLRDLGSGDELGDGLGGLDLAAEKAERAAQPFLYDLEQSREGEKRERRRKRKRERKSRTRSGERKQRRRW
jgi:hypothetical protein